MVALSTEMPITEAKRFQIPSGDSTSLQQAMAFLRIEHDRLRAEMAATDRKLQDLDQVIESLDALISLQDVSGRKPVG